MGRILMEVVVLLRTTSGMQLSMNHNPPSASSKGPNTCVDHGSPGGFDIRTTDQFSVAIFILAILVFIEEHVHIVDVGHFIGVPMVARNYQLEGALSPEKLSKTANYEIVNGALEVVYVLFEVIA
jgi:hypothetical protein